MADTRKIGRDARTGRIISVNEARRRPNTTTVETIRKPKK
jgi:hypothetical protein